MEFLRFIWHFVLFFFSKQPVKPVPEDKHSLYDKNTYGSGKF